MMSDKDLDHAETAIAKARTELADVCAGRKRWTMCIPARPGEDTDLVLGDGLREGLRAVAEVRMLRAELAHLMRTKDPVVVADAIRAARATAPEVPV